VPAEFKWPVVSMKDSLETVEAAYNYVCEALQIVFDEESEDSDNDEDNEEDSDETSGTDEETDSESDDDEESEDDEE
jgi:hypothetical protein